jgi:hypothetical protein
MGKAILDFVGRLWRAAGSVAWLSAFRCYAPFELMVGNAMPSKDIAVPGGAAPGFAAAYVLFARRDIAR